MKVLVPTFTSAFISCCRLDLVQLTTSSMQLLASSGSSVR